MRTALLALAALVLLGAEHLAATAVLAFRTDATRIILAADSASTSYAPDGSVRFGRGMCKIRPAGKWWTINGALDTAKGLDVPQLVAAAVAPTTTMAAALAAIDRE